MKRVTPSPHERDALPADANCEMIAYGGGDAFSSSRARFYNRLAENEQQLPAQPDFMGGSTGVERVKTP